ncbi:MAG: hypothetical protein ACKO9S_10915, partial [Bacteroidota bacterium]
MPRNSLKPLYADVILPLALRRTYTYLVPEDMADGLVAGMRVVVSFGKAKLYTVVVRKVHADG